jgi:hypothetical protein
MLYFGLNFRECESRWPDISNKVIQRYSWLVWKWKLIGTINQDEKS